MNDIVFRADSVGKSYGGRSVLKAATLWARAGTITVLLGRNGSGKSTLFRIAAGLLAPDYGVVLFRGRAHERPRLHRLAADGLFYLPERGLLQRNRTLRAHFDAVARRFDVPADPAELDVLRLDDLLDRRPTVLSGGERRRAEVALALARRPHCLLADEPLMGVAPKDIELLAVAFRALASTGCAVVISGHEVAPLFRLADEIIWIAAGTTHGLGTATQARENWQFRREYLGSLPTSDPPRPARHETAAAAYDDDEERSGSHGS